MAIFRISTNTTPPALPVAAAHSWLWCAITAITPRGMRRKLVLEISQNETPTKQAALTHAELICVAAAAEPNGGPPPVLCPVLNQFSNQCDQTTGPFSFGNF